MLGREISTINTERKLGALSNSDCNARFSYSEKAFRSWFERGQPDLTDSQARWLYCAARVTSPTRRAPFPLPFQRQQPIWSLGPVALSRYQAQNFWIGVFRVLGLLAIVNCEEAKGERVFITLSTKVAASLLLFLLTLP